MIDNLLNGAKFLFENKKYNEAANVLDYTLSFIENHQVLNDIYVNMRMCYFLANDVPNAFRIVEAQEKLSITQSWELTRDKANFLRYLNRHDEAYEVAKTIADDRTRNLAISWFEHKLGNIKYAFEITEKSRENTYWWKGEPRYPYKFWTGDYVKNLVVRAESGFGDQIIFARWIPELKKRCENLYFEGTGLDTTFNRNFSIPAFNSLMNFSDVHVIPIMSLAHVLKIDQSIDKPYLKPDPTIQGYYNKRYPKKQKLRIGICVQGEKTHVETNLRTLPLTQLVDALNPLAELVNLQKEITDKDDRIQYIPFETWEDTFGLIDTCDVVVSCDTSVAHAAASMGKTTMVLMHAAAYFTWNHNQDCSKSLWYKNAWCIHQDRPCKWEESIVKCADLIRKLYDEITV